MKAEKKKRVPPYGNFLYDFVKVTGILPVLLWLRPRVYYPGGNRIPKGGVLISSNHRSFLDPIILLAALPSRRLHSLCTKDLYKNAFMRFFLPRMHCILVDKDNFTATAFHDATDRLSAGHAVLVFPEGEVNKNGLQDNSLLAFKSGAVLMAYKSRTPILPIYIAKREKWYHRQRVVVGEQIDVAAHLGAFPSIDAMNRVTELLFEKEAELRAFAERGFTAADKNQENKKDEAKI